MDRRASIRAAVVVTLLAAGGCQDYNFNPVGHCLIQPGTKRVTLSDTSTADVLFVVDDSGSMAGEQQSLKDNFSRFIDVLATTNQARKAVTPTPLEAIDFHLAVTTTSDFYDEPPVFGSFCTDQCPGAAGSKVCCLRTSGTNTAPKSPQPPLCRTDGDCSGGTTCRTDCVGGGDVYATPATGLWKACCAPTVPHSAQPIPCSTIGEECGNLDRYYYQDATPGAAGACTMSYVDDAAPVTAAGPTSFPYPAGHFMANPANVYPPSPYPADRKVVHFTKGLNWAAGSGDATISQLNTAFGNNAQVGTCGSGQETGLEAARRAIKGVLGQEGLNQPGVTAGTDWLHDKSKLVVVWVTDEDDCSSPYSAADGAVFDALGGSGCLNANAEERLFAISQYVNYFTSLNRAFGAAFIVGANTGCQDLSCYAQVCCSGGACNGTEGVPTRYIDLASQLRTAGADVVVGSICDTFGDTLGRIAEIVKPPTGLALPTQPAATDVTILRITNSKGDTLHTCSRPAPAAPALAPGDVAWNETNAGTYLASLGEYDWWFTKTKDQLTNVQRLPSASSQYVYINHATGQCEADLGQTYSADYIGQLPPGGCADAAGCAAALGGDAASWTCYGYDGTVSPVRMGTCVCN